MDSWGAPALRSAHGKCWPLKTTLCFLLVKKFVQKGNKSPEKSYLRKIYKSFAPNISPSRQTSTKAFEYLKNVALALVSSDC